MKLKNLLNLTVLGAALTMTAVGCKHHPQGVTQLPGQRPPVGNPGLDSGNGINFNPNPNPTTSGPSFPGGAGIPQGPGHQGWPEDHDALKAQTVYFDYDKSSIKSSEQSKLEEVANYMKSHGDSALKVEGNCDERGTQEYNRSLGERRALAAREYLVHLGIDPNRIDTISYGADKPAVPGHGESAYAKNRRDDFVVLTSPKP